MGLIDKHKIKIQVGTFVTIILFCISAGITIAMYQSGVDSKFDKQDVKIGYLSHSLDLFDERLEVIETSVRGQDIKYAEIQKDLSYIKIILNKLEDKLE